MFISNHDTWCNASDAQRNEEIQALLTQGLSERFDFIDIKQFGCAGFSNPIARFTHRQTGMVMHLIPGSDEYKAGIAPELYDVVQELYYMDLDENDFEQQHPISIEPFFIGEFVITESQWQKMGAELPKSFGDDHGVDGVSREQVREAAKPFGLKLPSEMEWEYACKAGSNTIFYWGNQPNDDYAWTKHNVKKAPTEYFTLSQKVQKAPNAFGLVGMIGNLNEWVEDDENEYNMIQVSQKPYRSHSKRANGILRGGWINYEWMFCRSTSRVAAASGDMGSSARLAIGLDEVITKSRRCVPRDAILAFGSSFRSHWYSKR